MTAEKKTDIPETILDHNQKNAMIAAKLAESFRKLLGPNFGQRITPDPKEEQRPEVELTLPITPEELEESGAEGIAHTLDQVFERIPR